MASSLQDQCIMFNYLQNRYRCLFQLVSFLIKTQNTGDIPVTKNSTSPIHYLFTCSGLIFLENEIRCIWDESKIFETILSGKTKSLSHSTCECISLFDLGSILNNCTDFLKLTENNMATKLKPQGKNELVDYTTSHNTSVLKERVQFYTNLFKDNEAEKETLKVVDGYILIPEYMTYITGHQFCLQNTVQITQCTHKWQTYAVLMASECIRALSVLLYPYLFQKKLKCLTWDTNNVQLRYFLHHLEYACQELSNLVTNGAKLVTNDQKRVLISTIAILKDSAIRLGLAIGILQPLNKYKQSSKHLLANKYMATSEAYMIFNHITRFRDINSELNQNSLITIRSSNSFPYQNAVCLLPHYKETIKHSFGKASTSLEDCLQHLVQY